MWIPHPLHQYGYENLTTGGPKGRLIIFFWTIIKKKV